MPKYKSSYKYRGRSRQTSKKGRRALFGRPQRALPARQQFADQIGGYALNKGDTVKTNLKVFIDPVALNLGTIASGATRYDIARQYPVKLSMYGATNDDYRLITAAWQRYRIVGATIFVGQPYYFNTSNGTRHYFDSFVYLAVLKKAVNSTITTATMRGLENCEFKLMTASNDVLRKRMKFPAVPVSTATQGTTDTEAFKNMWLQTSDEGAAVPHYSFVIGSLCTNCSPYTQAQTISVDVQVQLELQLDRPNYQDNNISRINDGKPTQADLDKIEALYQKHFCDNDSESEVEDIPPYDEPLCKRLLGPVPLKPRARAQSSASA